MPGPASESSKTLHANLARGLHAAAQPLAILRARFFPEHILAMTEAELRELALSSAPQIERLCTLFGYVQQLVSAESTPSRPATVNVFSLFQQVVEGVELWYEDAGMTLRSTAPETGALAWIDNQRTQQALSAVLMIAHNLAKPGDTVDLSALCSNNSIQVCVHNVTCTTDSLNHEASLGMAVANAQMRSQGASFSYSLNPLLVGLQLPRAPLQN